MKILYFAPIPFDSLRQRPQFLAEQLAKQHDVYYVEPTISVLKSGLRGNSVCQSRRYDAAPRLHVVRLNGFFTAYRSLEIFDLLRLNAVSERLQLRQLAADCDAVWVGYPVWYGVICHMRGKKLIYDKMDDNIWITRNGLLRRLIMRDEPELIRKADYVFVTAQRFYEEIRPVNPNTFLLPNAVSSDFPIPKEKPRDPQKRVFGYVGTIGHWFDFSAVEAILKADEKNHVILAGPVEQKGPEHPRISYLGTVPHEKIPELLQSFDVCLYPFLRNELLDTIDPVKIYEYLAMNKPVLSVRSLETEKFGELVSLYDQAENLKNSARRDFAAPFSTEKERLKFVEENCWEKRAARIIKCLGDIK